MIRSCGNHYVVSVTVADYIYIYIYIYICVCVCVYVVAFIYACFVHKLIDPVYMLIYLFTLFMCILKKHLDLEDVFVLQILKLPLHFNSIEKKV